MDNLGLIFTGIICLMLIFLCVIGFFKSKNIAFIIIGIFIMFVIICATITKKLGVYGLLGISGLIPIYLYRVKKK